MRSTVAALSLVMSLVLPLVLSAAAVASPSTPAAKNAVADATGAALQADAARAIKHLREVPANQFADDDQRFRDCVLKRFGGTSDNSMPPGLHDPFARKAYSLYRNYWRTSLLQPALQAKAEARLFASLRALPGFSKAADMDAIEPLLAARLERSGLYSLQGRTGQLRELMIWHKQDTQSYRVELPEGAHTTKVMLLDDFASLGWADYATCHSRSTAGWATSDALYAVVSRYPSLDGEDFRVSLLGHETQHFADLGKFPGMSSWELEYRAKLVELTLATATMPRLLRAFGEDQGDDAQAPHAYANKRALAAIRQRLGLATDADLGQAGIARLHTAAEEELRADTRRRIEVH